MLCKILPWAALLSCMIIYVVLMYDIREENLHRSASVTVSGCGISHLNKALVNS